MSVQPAPDHLEPICNECGNDLVCEGYEQCSDCLAFACIECGASPRVEGTLYCIDDLDDLVPHQDAQAAT